MSAGTVLDPATITRILEARPDPATDAPWAGPLAELCYATGLPLERLLAVRVRDIDLEQRTLVLGAGRAVPFGRPAAQALGALIAGRPPAAALFADPAGRAIHPAVAHVALNVRARSAGLSLADTASALATAMHAHLVARGGDPEVAAGLVDAGSPRRRAALSDDGPASGAIDRARRRLAARRRRRR